MIPTSATYAAKKKDSLTRVLIADDNRDNALTLGVLLRSEGYIVHLAKDGAEALRMAQAYRPDIALLDLVMPGQSGFELAAELRRRFGDQCPVLIAITAHDTVEAQDQAGASGFHRFVAKPYDADALLQLIESLEATA